MSSPLVRVSKTAIKPTLPTSSGIIPNCICTAYFISNNPNINAGDINYGGKTGTTNNSANLWYIGYNPEFTIGIWKGFSNTNNLKAENAGSDCALIWNDIISDYYKIALK